MPFASGRRWAAALLLAFTATHAFARELIVGQVVDYAGPYGEASRDYVSEHAQEMSAEVCAAHIALYVNENSIDIGDEGLVAIQRLLDFAA